MASFTPGSARVLLAGVVSILCLVMVLAIASVGSAAAPDDSGGDQHGPLFGHLPPTQKELEVVGRLEVSGEFGDVVEGQIADLSVYKGYAYLNSWDSATLRRAAAPTSSTSATRPRPRRSAFIPAHRPLLPRRGRARGHRSTRRSSRATCSRSTTRPTARTTRHGPRAVDRQLAAASTSTTSPTRRNPKALVQQRRRSVARRRLSSSPTRPWASTAPTTACSSGRTDRAPTSSASDNIELARRRHLRHHRSGEPRVHRRPRPGRAGRPRARTSSALARTADTSSTTTWSSSAIGGQMRMLVSYWDAGYVQLDVTDPANPDVHHRHGLRRARPAHRVRSAGGQRPPGGVLARQPVLPRRRRGLRPYRVDERSTITTGPDAGEQPSSGGRAAGRRSGAARPHAQRPDRLRRLRLPRARRPCRARDSAGLPDLEAGRGGDPRDAARPGGRSRRRPRSRASPARRSASRRWTPAGTPSC